MQSLIDEDGEEERAVLMTDNDARSNPMLASFLEHEDDDMNLHHLAARADECDDANADDDLLELIDEDDTSNSERPPLLLIEADEASDDESVATSSAVGEMIHHGEEQQPTTVPKYPQADRTAQQAPRRARGHRASSSARSPDVVLGPVVCIEQSLTGRAKPPHRAR